MSLLNGFKDVFKRSNQVDRNTSKDIIWNTRNTTLAVLAASYMLSWCGLKTVENQSWEELKPSFSSSETIKPEIKSIKEEVSKNSDSIISWNANGISLRNGTFSAYVNPSNNNINSGINLLDSDSELKLSVMWWMNDAGWDYGLKASYAALYSAAKLWTYIWIEKGSEIEKLVVSQSMAISWWKVQMSYGLLRKIISTTFAKTWTSYKPQITQNAIWLDYSKINISDLVRELKTSVVFYDVQNKDLWVIWNTIINDATLYNWTDIHWGIRGWNKLVAEIKATFKLSETFKMGISGWYEKIKYKSMFITAWESESWATWWLDLTYQPNAHNNFTTSAITWKNYSNYKVEARHNFWNNLEMFATAERIDYKTTGIKSDTRWDIWLTYKFWGPNNSKLSPLFTDIESNNELSLNDLKPNPLVDTNAIQAMKQVTWDEHMVKILKSSLTWASNLVLNPNGTLQAVNLDSWVTNLVSISWVNFTQHLSHFSVQGGKFIHITWFEQLFAPATYKISALDALWTVTVFTMTTVKWSVELLITPTIVNWVTPANAAAYLAWTMTLAQLQATLIVADTVAPVLSSTTQTFTTTVGTALTIPTITANDAVDWAITPVQTWTLPNFNAIWTYAVIYTATDAAWNPSTITHTYQVNAVPDTIPPTSPTLTSIEAWAAITNKQTVNLIISHATPADVAKWFVSESATAPTSWNAGWVTTKPTTYTFANTTNGTKTVYVYVQDAAWNVQSVGTSDTITFDNIAPTTMSFSWVTPDTKNTQYNSLAMTLNDSIIGWSITSLTSSNWGTISTPTIDWTGKVIFNFLTPNVAGTTLTLTWADAAWNTFTTTLNVTLPLNAISTPTISLAAQTVNDNGGFLSTALPAPTVTWVVTWAVYSIVADPTWGALTINTTTWVATYNWNLWINTNYNITIKVTNPDWWNKSVTFVLTVINNA